MCDKRAFQPVPEVKKQEKEKKDDAGTETDEGKL